MLFPFINLKLEFFRTYNTMIYKSLFVIFHIKVVQNCFIWGYHNLQRQFEVRNLVEYVKTSVLERNTPKILLNVG